MLSVNSSSGGVELKFISYKVAFFQRESHPKEWNIETFMVILLEGGYLKSAGFVILTTLSDAHYNLQ